MAMERGDGRSPLWMHTDERPPSVVPMFERMVLDDQLVATSRL